MGSEIRNDSVRDSLGLFEFMDPEKCNNSMRDSLDRFDTLQFVNKKPRLRFTKSICFFGVSACSLGFKWLKLKCLL